jgi:hypothetical protein
MAPRRIAVEIGQAVFDSNVTTLIEHLSVFGDQVDQSLYLADQALRDVIRKINDLPRPGSYAARSQ